MRLLTRVEIGQIALFKSMSEVCLRFFIILHIKVGYYREIEYIESRRTCVDGEVRLGCVRYRFRIVTKHHIYEYFNLPNPSSKRLQQIVFNGSLLAKIKK